ncbi:MAG: hypothetical protein HPM95_16745 [Alphaproteobacteria bacterium]|nr:hypothetical protein [Alphaproteobacteria bacterium]
MNKIVKRHYPVANLPEELRKGLPDEALRFRHRGDGSAEARAEIGASSELERVRKTLQIRDGRRRGRQDLRSSEANGTIENWSPAESHLDANIFIVLAEGQMDARRAPLTHFVAGCAAADHLRPVIPAKSPLAELLVRPFRDGNDRLVDMYSD